MRISKKIKKILNWDRYIDRAKFDPVFREISTFRFDMIFTSFTTICVIMQKLLKLKSHYWLAAFTCTYGSRF